jgi:hypothetical protein
MSAFCANTNVIDLIGLHAELDGSFINDATVTVTIRDAAGVDLAGAWPLAMTYVPASTGNYRALQSAALPFVAKASYVAIIDANGGSNRTGHWEFHFKPVDRSAQDA